MRTTVFHRSSTLSCCNKHSDIKTNFKNFENHNSFKNSKIITLGNDSSNTCGAEETVLAKSSTKQAPNNIKTNVRVILCKFSWSKYMYNLI